MKVCLPFSVRFNRVGASRLASLILAVVGVLISGFGAPLSTVRPLAAQEEGGCASRPFAEELTPAGNVWGTTFAGPTTLYTFRAREEGESSYYIARARRSDPSAPWGPWERVDLGGDFSDLYPTVSPDGEHLVFLSYRPLPGAAESETANLWHARWDGAGWAAPKFMVGVSDPGRYESQASFGRSGALHFRRDEVGGRRSTSLSTRWEDGEWSPPEPDERIERWKGWSPGLHLWGGRRAPDDRFVLLDVSPIDAETGRRGPSDQWVAVRRPDGSWTEPAPAGCGLNHPGYDTFPFFTEDGGELVVVQSFDRFRSVSTDALLADHLRESSADTGGYLDHVEDRAAVARAVSMLEALGGREGWSRLASLYIRAIHTEASLDEPYTSEIWRDLGLSGPRVRIEQRGNREGEPFHSVRILNGGESWSIRDGAVRTMSSEVREFLVHWDRHVFYETIRTLARGGPGVEVRLDDEGRLVVLREGRELARMEIDGRGLPVVYVTPGREGAEPSSVRYTEWGESGGLVHPVVSEPEGTGAVFRATEWVPATSPSTVSFRPSGEGETVREDDS